MHGVIAAAALEEFRRFLQLQVAKQDSEAIQLTPTALMDHMWRASVLDTNLYDKLQE